MGIWDQGKMGQFKIEKLGKGKRAKEEKWREKINEKYWFRLGGEASC